MFKTIFSVLSVGLVTMAVGSARAATISPGQSLAASTLNYGGTTLLFTGGSPSTSAFSANYSAAVFADPANVFCANCLDFVYQINETGVGSVTSLSAGSFAGYNLSVGYSLAPESTPVAPTTISLSADGSMLDFLFASGVTQNAFSDFLVVQTNATTFAAFDAGSTTLANGNISSTGVGAEPTPEPSSFILLGSGLIGMAAAARRKLSI